MHHAVLNILKGIFDRLMNLLGDVVRLHQSQAAVCFNLGIHIDAGAKHSGLQAADAQHTVLFADDLTHLLHGLFVAGFVDHLVDRVTKYVDGSFQNEQADNHAGNRVQNRESQSCAADTD